MVTNFVSYRTCSLGAEVSQDLLDRFSQSFYRMKAFWVQMIDLDLFFRYVKGLCHGMMATDFVKKMANSALSSLWHSETEWDNAMYMHD